MKTRHALSGVVLAVVLMAALVYAAALAPSPAAAQNTDCYAMQGGSKWVCDNGGEMEFQTGATLDVQAGATSTFANTPVFSAGITADDLTLSDDLIVGDDTLITGTATVAAGIIADDLTLSDDLVVADDVRITGTLFVDTGAAILGNSSIGDGSNADDLSVWGDASINSDIILQGFLRLDGEALAVTQDGIITPTNSYVELTAAGDVSTGVIASGTEGDLLFLVNTANQTITISDTGTLKLSGDLALAQYDSAVLIFEGTNWIQLSETNN